MKHLALTLLLQSNLSLAQAMQKTSLVMGCKPETLMFFLLHRTSQALSLLVEDIRGLDFRSILPDQPPLNIRLHHSGQDAQVAYLGEGDASLVYKLTRQDHATYVIKIPKLDSVYKMAYNNVADLQKFVTADSALTALLQRHRLRFAEIIFADESLMIQEYVSRSTSSDSLAYGVTSLLQSEIKRIIRGSNEMRFKWYELDVEGRDNIVPSQNGTFVIVDPFVSQLSKLLGNSAW